MSFWLRLQANPETWPEMERAARQRFWDGFTLLASGGRGETGGVYFLGYVAEMLLKTAFFRERGISRHVDTSPYRRLAAVSARGYRRRNDHDLRYWLLALERLRVANDRPIPPALVGAMRMRVDTLADNWQESLRYRDESPSDSEVEEILGSVEWLLDNHRRWR